MRQLPRWVYRLFMAAMFAFCIFYFRDLTVPVIMLGFMLGSGIYRRLVQHNQMKWLLPSGLALALLLGTLYFTADFVLFPHSPRIAYRLHDACWSGAISALGGLCAEIYSPAGKRIARDHAMNGTANQRRR